MEKQEVLSKRRNKPSLMSRLILKQALCVLLIVFFISTGLPPATSQTRTRGCATYQTNLLIDLVNSIPTHVAVGGTVVTKVHVIYPDGTPVVLSPETISFLWSGITSQKTIENAPVVPAGDPGFYLYTQMVTADFPTGTVTIYAVWCSGSDVAGNYGPPSNTSSETTITPADYSIVAIGPIPPPGPPTAQQLFSTYGVPAIIALLLLAALLLLLVRRKKR